MKIGIIADTHDNLPAIDKAVKRLNDEGNDDQAENRGEDACVERFYDRGADDRRNRVRPLHHNAGRDQQCGHPQNHRGDAERCHA